MTDATPAEAVVADAAAAVEPDVADVDGFDEWVSRHGLGRSAGATTVVARQAAFHVVLTAALIECYRRDGVELPRIDGENYRSAVATVAERTDDAAFEPYFLSAVARRFDEATLSSLVEAGARLHETEDPAETVGRTHESLVPQADRRRYGQFRTPPAIAELMAEWAVRDAGDVVLDPGVGAGALAAAALSAKTARVGESSPADVIGIDVSELSTLMGTVALKLAAGGGGPRLRTGDFFDLSPETVGRVDAVVSNPPYSRHHELDEAEKRRINGRIECEAGRSFSGLSPLYVYFYVHATEFIDAGGRATFVTPSEFLETNYGEDLKAFLLSNYRIRAMILYDRDGDSRFDDALTTSLVSFLERRVEDDVSDDARTTFVRVDEWPGREAVIDAVEDGVAGETAWGYLNPVPQDALDPGNKWGAYFDPIDIGETDRLVPLERIADVSRGIATGQNEYFCLTESERAGSFDGREWDIDEAYLSKLIRKSASVPHYDYRESDWERQRRRGDPVWLLYHLEGLDRDGVDDDSGLDDGSDRGRDRPGVRRYLEYGTSDDVAAHDGYLARNRTPWYLVDRRDPAPILYTYMSRDRGRFVYNRTGARNLNNLHGIYPGVELDESELKALLAYLNSPFADDVVKRSGRTYSTGMDKVEPGELEGVPVLDPRDLSDATVDRLAGLFDDLCEASRDGDEERVLAELGQAIEAVVDQ